MGFVEDPRDREAASLVCCRWHRVDALSRKHVMVPFCYAVSRCWAGSAAEAAFLRLLDAEVDRFNAFFLEREEDFVIRHRARSTFCLPSDPPSIRVRGVNASAHRCECDVRLRVLIVVVCAVQELKETAKKVAEDALRRLPSSAAETRSVRKEIVDLHGEMVLLLNYSAINYTGLAKILKKSTTSAPGGSYGCPSSRRCSGSPSSPRSSSPVQARPRVRGHQGGRIRGQQRPRRRVCGDGPRGRSGSRRAGHLPEHRGRAGDHGHKLRSGSSTYGHFSLPPMVPPESDLLRCVCVQFAAGPVSI
ncbi:unnamed protein product [Miscanthus lutarioriparius]|uniref:SPX domain-containing protein n=1 Tax=Miscanthus lutarioriparius TaxID=422564 RepID=A0A811MIJ2_9POAL|nr:unnamed protein product [Miscanthus lutarioriparius]